MIYHYLLYEHRMAVLLYEEEEQGQGQQIGQQPGQPSGGTAITGGGTVRPTTGETQSGSWTNLNKYLQLNQPQGQQMAQNIAQDVSRQRQDVQGAYGQAGSDLYQGALDLNKERYNKVGQLSDYLMNKPTVEGLQGMEQEGFFKTPQAPTVDLSSQAYQEQKLQERINALGDEPGRIAELQRLQNPQATRGEGLLNQYLLQGNLNPLVEQQQMGAATEGQKAGIEKTQDWINRITSTGPFESFAQTQASPESIERMEALRTDYWSPEEKADWQNRIAALKYLQGII